MYCVVKIILNLKPERKMRMTNTKKINHRTIESSITENILLRGINKLIR